MPFLNQQKGENDRRKYFMINLHERMLSARQQSFVEIDLEIFSTVILSTW